jgi:hypothetical protein
MHSKPQRFNLCKDLDQINKRIVHTYVLLTFFVMVAENRYVFRSRGITFKISSRDFSNSSFSNLSASSRTWSKCIQPGKHPINSTQSKDIFQKKNNAKETWESNGLHKDRKMNVPNTSMYEEKNLWYLTDDPTGVQVLQPTNDERNW